MALQRRKLRFDFQIPVFSMLHLISSAKIVIFVSILWCLCIISFTIFVAIKTERKIKQNDGNFFFI